MSTAAASPFDRSTAPASPGSSSTLPSRVAERLRRLDGLLERNCQELQQMYEGARVPLIGDVAGDLHGRMLAWPSLESASTVVAGAIRAFAGAKAFPWRGKSFFPKSALGGDGINRVLSDRLRLFRFETFIAPSRAGAFDALQLDYDLAGNPPVIRSIKDEIRELEPGLWLGQAWLKTKKREILWLYFALARADEGV